MTTPLDIVEHPRSVSPHPLREMTQRARFISSLLRIDREPNTEAARDALASLREMGVMREINRPPQANNLAEHYDTLDSEYAGLI